ncbi:MAG: F0F1 ATP synthase subunit B [Ruminococcaceae bacterium]|nr:F0F1 ATP synthase subunit B [Oscillospiraceae bacterium]
MIKFFHVAVDAADKFESFVGVNLFTMIFAWVNLLILYLFLKKLLFKPVKNMIDSRQKEIDDMYSDAESSRVEAAEMKSEYEEKLAAANEESEEILKRAVRKAQLREEEILSEANEKAARTLERANEQVELEKKRAINEVKDEVSEMAISIAAAVIERDVKGDEHKDMIDDFISRMGD